jgi:hypothetical protein
MEIYRERNPTIFLARAMVKETPKSYDNKNSHLSATRRCGGIL